MAILSTPESGQPLDVSYIYEIVNAINKLAEGQRGSTYASLGSYGTGANPEDVKINNSKIVTGYYPFSSQSITSNSSFPFSYDFPGADFQLPPIVTATLTTSSSSSSAAKVATVIITNITTSRVEGQVNFGTLSAATSFAGGVNIIAIGKPQ